MITAGGKNVAPAEMEMLISAVPGVAQVVVVGDRKPYLSALVTMDPENLDGLAEIAGVAEPNLASLAESDAVAAWMQEQVEELCNAKVARYQTIKYLRLIPNEFTVDGGELTPTMKIRRAVVNEKYAELIDSMYSG